MRIEQTRQKHLQIWVLLDLFRIVYLITVVPIECDLLDCDLVLVIYLNINLNVVFKTVLIQSTTNVMVKLGQAHITFFTTYYI